MPRQLRLLSERISDRVVAGADMDEKPEKQNLRMLEHPLTPVKKAVFMADRDYQPYDDAAQQRFCDPSARIIYR